MPKASQQWLEGLGGRLSHFAVSRRLTGGRLGLEVSPKHAMADPNIDRKLVREGAKRYTALHS